MCTDRRRQGQLEARSMQPLVQHARPVPLESQQLQPGGTSIREDEHSAALRWIMIASLTRCLRESIEATSHVDRIGADEDSNPNTAFGEPATQAAERARDSGAALTRSISRSSRALSGVACRRPATARPNDAVAVTSCLMRPNRCLRSYAVLRENFALARSLRDRARSSMVNPVRRRSCIPPGF